MAAPLCLRISNAVGLRLLPNRSAIPLLGTLPQTKSVRDASKKAGAMSKNKRSQTAGKRRGIKRQDGKFVHREEVLVTQLGLKLYPGENVGIRQDNTLYALCDGRVIVTCEELSPYPDSPLYERVKQGLKIYRKFFNVYPTPLHAKFRLVSQT